MHVVCTWLSQGTIEKTQTNQGGRACLDDGRLFQCKYTKICYDSNQGWYFPRMRADHSHWKKVVALSIPEELCIILAEIQPANLDEHSLSTSGQRPWWNMSEQMIMITERLEWQPQSLVKVKRTRITISRSKSVNPVYISIFKLSL